MRLLAWLSRSVATIVAGALLITGVTVAVGPRLWQMANAHEQMPVELPEFQPLSQRSLAYDVGGTLIAVFERENSQPINLADVPDDVIAAVLAVEDNDYWTHSGVNLRGFTRALLSNFSTDSARQGASTITQQVVKNEFLAGLPRDGRYKALQAHYALMLENKITKEQILQRYLSTVFFGNNAYGLAAAAEVYFGKNVSDLDLIEGAFLAGLVRSPSGYDPIRRVERSRFRFKQVMTRLADVGLLTEAQATDLGENWKLPETTFGTTILSAPPSYYSTALKDYLLTRSDLLGETEQDRANLLYRGGLRIHTTLDPLAQAKAEEARNLLPDTPQGFDASIVSLDVATGAIRVMVGGRGFVPRQSEINMALRPRQTGSSIKFFVLAAALEAGAQPTDMIHGEKPCTLPSADGKPFVINDGVSQPDGTLELQTWKSINCAYSRLAQIVGLNRVVDTTYRMAHSVYLNREIPAEDREPIQPYASFATGANEMAPIDMAAGMQTVANQGLHHDPYYVEYIDRADGTRFFTHADDGTQVLDPGVALTTVSVLKGVLKSGTASAALRNFPRPAAGKTGTQEDNTNSWFVGATPQLATAVWVGDPNGYTPMTGIPEFARDGVRNGRVQGGTYPAKIWGAFTGAALEGQDAPDWPAAPKPTRAPVRLYLPGEECLFVQVSGGGSPDVTTSSVAPAGGWAPQQNQPPKPPQPPQSPQPPTVTSTPVDSVPVTAPAPVYRAVKGGTTIPPDVLDPHAPLPTAPLTQTAAPCGKLAG